MHICGKLVYNTNEYSILTEIMFPGKISHVKTQMMRRYQMTKTNLGYICVSSEQTNKSFDLYIQLYPTLF